MKKHPGDLGVCIFQIHGDYGTREEKKKKKQGWEFTVFSKTFP